MKKNIVDIAERIKNILSLHTNAALAEVLGITPANLSSYKRRKAIPYDEITELCRKKSLPIEYILYGTGTPHLHRPVGMPGQQEIPSNTVQFTSPASHPGIELSLLLMKTMNILKSGTQFAPVLKASIEAFDFAVNDIKELEVTKQNVEDLRSRVSQLETTLSDEKEKSSGGEEH